ncbi:hypothetical protein N431DRAFT_560103 [Stipitochalara longipes BDJ]|nr:hypothetical protein N431DRAFT_560103 [Stipitochalara longipes BDJ]
MALWLVLVIQAGLVSAVGLALNITPGNSLIRPFLLPLIVSLVLYALVFNKDSITHKPTWNLFNMNTAGLLLQYLDFGLISHWSYSAYGPTSSLGGQRNANLSLADCKKLQSQSPNLLSRPLLTAYFAGSIFTSVPLTSIFSLPITYSRSINKLPLFKSSSHPQHHPTNYHIYTIPEVRYRASYESCLTSKVKYSQSKLSYLGCIQRGRKCVYSQCRRIGRPRHESTTTLASQTSPQRRHPQRATRDTYSKTQKQSSRPQSSSGPTQTQQENRSGAQLARSDNVHGYSLGGNDFFMGVPISPSSTAQGHRRSSYALGNAATSSQAYADYLTSPTTEDEPGLDLLASFTNSENDIEVGDWEEVDDSFEISTSYFLLQERANSSTTHF